MSLIGLLIVVIILGLLFYAATLLPIPQPFKNIALVIVLLIGIVYLVSALGYAPGFRIR